MLFKRKRQVEIPTPEEVESLQKRYKYLNAFKKSIISTISVLIVVASVAVLVTSIFFPVVQVVGDSMEPALTNNDMLLLYKTKKYEKGDLVCFYYQNRLLIKRVVGVAGDEIVIEEDGTVFINGEELHEPYVFEKALGECDITFPYTVPEQTVFLLGDHRATSVDSRSSAIGSVENERIVGKVLFRFWPLKDIVYLG